MRLDELDEKVCQLQTKLKSVNDKVNIEFSKIGESFSKIQKDVNISKNIPT